MFPNHRSVRALAGFLFLLPAAAGAQSPAAPMRCAFTPDGARVAGGAAQPDRWTLSFAMEAWGREGRLAALEPAAPARLGRRIEYRRGPLTEWYLETELGLEQGFELERPPAGPRGAPLVLALRASGELRGEVLPGERDARFVDAGGKAVVHYTGLRAWDALGCELAAWLAVAGEELCIRIDDRDAVYPLLVDPWIATEEAKIVAGAPATSDLFGSAVAVWGGTAVVGADADDLTAGNNAGSAHVFVRNAGNWSSQQMLTAGDAAASDHFGCAVAVWGDTAVIGARHDNNAGGSDAGSAYVFVRSGSTWTEQQRLSASDGDDGDLFGCAVAIDGDTILVGARLDNNGGGANAGSAYVFVRNGSSWTEQHKLTASDPLPSDVFGWSVSVSGDTALVGAYGVDFAGGVNAGAAYVFARNGSSWTEQAKLLPSLQQANADFGWSVALSADTAIVGAHLEDHAGSGAGAAYVFTRNGSTWSQQQRLVALDAAGGDSFGYSLALSDDVALVGAPFDDHAGGGSAGAAYVFVRGGSFWCQQAVLTASDASSSDQFGWSVALAGDTAVAGANEDDPAGFTDAGAAYAFRLSADSFYCTPGTSASGCQATISTSGTASASLPSGFSLMAASVEGAKGGLFFFGTNGFQANSWGNGSSFQCIVPPVKRAGVLIGTGTAGQCDGAFSQDLNALWCPSCPGSSKNPGASAVVQAQLWYRDPLSTSNQTTSFSDAVEFCVAP